MALVYGLQLVLLLQPVLVWKFVELWKDPARASLRRIHHELVEWPRHVNLSLAHRCAVTNRDVERVLLHIGLVPRWCPMLGVQASEVTLIRSNALLDTSGRRGRHWGQNLPCMSDCSSRLQRGLPGLVSLKAFLMR